MILCVLVCVCEKRERERERERFHVLWNMICGNSLKFAF